MLHTHSFTYHRTCIMFFSLSTSVSSVSIISPMLHTHSFIYPPTLYKVFLRVLQFPLSVSFHQCTILIHFLPQAQYNVFLPVVLQFLLSVLFHQCSILNHSSIYHQWCITFFSEYFSFPCQYHSTNAQYSFIHLPPNLHNVFSASPSGSSVSIILPMLHTHSFIYPQTLHKVFLPLLQFPLSVSFHQCSILIHSSTIHGV